LKELFLVDSRDIYEAILSLDSEFKRRREGGEKGDPFVCKIHRKTVFLRIENSGLLKFALIELKTK